MFLKSIRRRSAPVSVLTLAVFLSTLLPASRAHADPPGGEDTDVTPVEHGVGGPHTMGQASGASGSADALITADPVTGAAHASLGFELPAARGSAQPSLSLTYSSSSGMGAAGMGWSLDIPSIERRNSSSFPNLINVAPGQLPGPPKDPTTDPDDFVMNGQPLVPICIVTSTGTCGNDGNVFPGSMSGWTYYHPETDSFVRAFRAPDYSAWMVQLKSGVWLNFGVPSDDPADAEGLETALGNTVGSWADKSDVYRWDLVREYDSSLRNEIVYHWAALGFSDGEQPRSEAQDGLKYLTDVYYTRGVSEGPLDTSQFAHHVQLFWRGHDTVLRYSPGWKSTPARVLGDVAVTSIPMSGASGSTRSLVRLYHLGYSDETAFEQRFLLSFEMHACSAAENAGNIADPSTWAYAGATACPSLPATTFAYNTQGGGAFPALALSRIKTQDLGYTTGYVRAAMVDVDGDGVSDLLGSQSSVQNETPDSGTTVTLGASGTQAPVVPDVTSGGIRAARPGDLLPSLRSYWGDWWGTDRQTLLFFNDDLGDTAFNYYLATPPNAGTFEIYGFAGTGSGTTTPAWLGSGPASIPQIHADGEPDYTEGWDNQTYWEQGKVFDVDGDGLTDVALIPESRDYPAKGDRRTYFSVRPKDGKTFNGIFARKVFHSGLLGYNGTGFHAIADMDADGLADVVEVEQARVATSLRWWKNRGDGRFENSYNGGYEADDGSAAPDILVANCTTCNWSVNQHASNIAVGDVNGDSLADFVVVHNKALTVYTQTPRAFQAGAHVAFTLSATLANAAPDDNASISIADTDGSGTPHIVLVDVKAVSTFQLQASIPHYGLLRTIFDGAGRQTTVTYDSVAHLAQVASPPWATKLPIPTQVVVRTETQSQDKEPDGTPDDYVTALAYRDPSYDARDHAFLGFGSVTTTTPGSAASPGTVTTVSYVPPTCGAAPCGYDVDYGWRFRRGLPYAVQVSDAASGQMLSATITKWAYMVTHYGVDTRRTRMVYPKQVDTFIGDGSHGTTPVQVGGVEPVFSEVDTTYAWTPPPIAVPVGSAGVVNLRRTQSMGLLGNVSQSVDFGQVGVDTPILTSTIWGLGTLDSSGWSYRPTQTKVGYADSTGATFSGPTREMDYAYNSVGLPTTVSSPLSGTAPLQRGSDDVTKVAPTPASASVNSPAGHSVQLASYSYDWWWNVNQVQGPNGHCTGITYATGFNDLPVAVAAYRNGCGNQPLTTALSYDRGLGAVTVVTDPSLTTTIRQYDSFGRLKEVDQPSAVILGTTDLTPAVSIDWSLYPQALHVTTPAHESYVYYDGFGRQRYRLDNGDLSTQWILRGASQLYPSGRVQRSYLPVLWDGPIQPGQIHPAFASMLSDSATYDALGRVLVATGSDGNITAKLAYAPLSVTAVDGEQIPGGLHAGASSTVTYDGHGRTVTSGQSLVSPARSITSRQTYLATGEVQSVRRSHSDGADTFTRTFKYDSLGRLVGNIEPNTSRAYSVLGNVQGAVGWTYAYDDAGDLVGTSDARGCGENLAYDNLGRLASEDYSPCTLTQTPYSAPSGSTGYEALYGYDAPESSSGAAPSAIYAGKLTATYDRGQHSQFMYDARGRTTAHRRQLAVPHNAVANGPGSYAPHWFEQDVSLYDEANRVVTRTTGADPAVFGLAATTSLTTHYSARGNASRVDGSYGALLASQGFNPDGSLGYQVFGDAANTETDYGYASSGRVQSIHVHRPAGPWKSGPGYTAAGADTEDDLENLSFIYDRVGNPLEIFDMSSAAWPVGSKPQRVRNMKYDDAYRLQTIHTDYAGIQGGPLDGFASPPYAPEVAAASREFPAMASPQYRVADQGYAYDWMGNTTSSSDDANTFPDRSLGTITNGIPGSLSVAPQGPNWLVSATEGTSSLAVQYDTAGEILGINVARGAPCTSDCGTAYHYTWDEVGRLATAARTEVIGRLTELAVTESFAYDAGGHRILKSYQGGGTAPTTYFANVFDSLRLEGATFPDASGDYTRNISDESVFLVANGVTYGRAVYSQSDPLISASGTLHVFLEIGDHLGSTSFVIDRDTSEVVERATYQAYGAPDSDFRPARWASFRDSFRYTGHEDDSEVGLVYFGARYYSPMLGRWMSADPLAIHGGAGDPNPYAFVRGSPMRYVDPLGLTDCDKSSQSCRDDDPPITTPVVGGGGGAGGGGARSYVVGGREGAHGQSDVLPPKEVPPPPPPPAAAGRVGGTTASGMGASILHNLAGQWRTMLFGVNFPTAITVTFLENVSDAGDSSKSEGQRVKSGVLAIGAIIPMEAEVAEGVAFVDTAAVQVMRATEGVPGAYSVAFEAKLTPQGIGTYGSHFVDANEQLLKAMADPETANALRSTLGENFEGSIVSSSGTVRGVSPSGWTWHHVPDQPGVVQLVLGFQHGPGSAWQPMLHPGGVGGMSIWGSLF